jgi:hypothetical protein
MITAGFSGVVLAWSPGYIPVSSLMMQADGARVVDRGCWRRRTRAALVWLTRRDLHGYALPVSSFDRFIP